VVASRVRERVPWIIPLYLGLFLQSEVSGNGCSPGERVSLLSLSLVLFDWPVYTDLSRRSFEFQVAVQKTLTNLNHNI